MHTPVQYSRGIQFRREFSRISEIRALAPALTNVMALTATATSVTRKKIIESLEVIDCKVILHTPNNVNIYYAVQPMPSTGPMQVLSPLIRELCTDGVKSKRTILFCQTYDHLLQLFQMAALELGRHGKFSVEGTDPSDSFLCDKFDACTSLARRENIIQSFTKPDGTLRLVFATVAFSMGLDSPNVRRIVHWSPPNDLDMYVQETGRAERDGEDAVAVLYYSDIEKRLSEEMKSYCHNTVTCRRVVLMSAFGIPGEIKKPSVLHKCCDLCARTCNCSECTNALLCVDSVNPSDLQGDFEPIICSTDRPRPLPKKIRSKIKEEIILYRYKICERSSCPAATLIAGVEICTGISNSMIEHVVSNSTSVTTVSDVLELGVPTEHAEGILDIILSYNMQ